MATAIPKACLASSAIRCRDVETGPNRGVLAVFPSTGAPCRCPLPSTGSRGLNSPASAVSGRRRRPSKGSPPSAAQTVRAVFPHTAFTRLPGGREMEGINEWTFWSPVGLSLWVANYYSARNPLRLSSLVILGVVARMFRCATRSSCWCT